MVSDYMKRRLAIKNGLAVSEKKEPVTAKKNSDKEIPLLLKKAQETFNLFIRLRDKGNKCICGCGKVVEECGHFYPMNYSGVRFDEVNGNGIAKSCNNFCNAAIDPKYRKGLIKRIGEKEFEWLNKRAVESKHKKWSREELQELIREYQFKIQQFKK